MTFTRVIDIRGVRQIAWGCLVVMMSVQAWAVADSSAASEPEKVVQVMTDQLLKTARKNSDALKKDPEPVYKEMETILEDLVSFKFIARNVMGDNYWKQATDKQRDDFLSSFRRSLVVTLVKGMSQNLDFKIELLPDESKVNNNLATIVQKVSGPESSNMVVYTLGHGKSGQWKVLNVVLDGVNLGTTFRSQFAQGVKDNNGDLDATIAGWLSQG